MSAERQESRSLEEPVDNESTGLTEEQRQLVEQNLPLVHHIVARLASRFPATYCRDDLVQAGTMGLIEAAQRFDPSLGFSFATYVGRRIEGAAIDSIRRDDWAPRRVRVGQRMLADATSQLTNRLGRVPTPNELREASGLDEDKFERLQVDLTTTQVESLTGNVEGSDDWAMPISDLVIESTTLMPDESFEHGEMIEALREGLGGLSERHRLIITGHFLEGRTMTELGAFLGVTQSRASQLKAEALKEIRKNIGSRLLGTASVPDHRINLTKGDLVDA